MDFKSKKVLTDKINKSRRKKIFVNKKIVLYALSAILIIFLVTKVFSLIGNSINNLSSHSSKPSENSVKINTIKHEDSYYDDMVKDYIVKVDASLKDNVLKSYNNLGIVKSSGYINFRSEPNENNTRSIIGLMNNGDALDIITWDLEGSSIYCKVKSGGMTGYVAKKFVVTGEEAKNIAINNIAVRAEILVDKLRMRTEPNTDNDNVVGTTYKGERYKLKSIKDNWALVYADNIEDVEYAYVSADNKYLDIKYCLSEARTQDLKSDVLNYYDNIGVSVARDYINVRKTAKANGTIIGKLPGKAGCEVLGESGDFYKIKSGKVTGYVSKKYLATGKRAESLALEYADLRAIIKIAALRVRSGPGTKYKQWTTIRREETYIVTNQLDGWVEIEIDEGSDKGYISTSNNYVEVRYALDQAIEFHPDPPASSGKKSNVSTLRTNIKNTALKYIGGAYVWGGNTLGSGVDCSGFVQQIYKLYGVSLPRVSKEQAKQGTAVSSSNKKVGDLIFYANSSGVVDHVAIYIGNNQVVHAASTKTGIKISNYDYRTPHSIRNVLGNR